MSVRSSYPWRNSTAMPAHPPSAVTTFDPRRHESRQHPGLAALALAVARGTGRPLPPLGGFGVAGPVKDGRIHTTSLPWVLDERELCRVLDLRSVRLVNDFHALALGLPA